MVVIARFNALLTSLPSATVLKIFESAAVSSPAASGIISSVFSFFLGAKPIVFWLFSVWPGYGCFVGFVGVTFASAGLA